MKHLDTTFIYALNDPETGECRYVGKANNPHVRLFGYGGHLMRCHKDKHHCANWVRSLVARGLVPHLEILDEVPRTDWKLWERAWIKASREIGMDLTNCTEGGGGCANPTPETRKRKSEAVLGKKNPFFGRKHTSATREKIRIARLGKKMSSEACARMSATRKGRKHPPGTGKKIGDAQRGEKNHNFGKKRDPAVCAKLSAANSGEGNPFFGKKHTLTARAKISASKRRLPWP